MIRNETWWMRILQGDRFDPLTIEQQRALSIAAKAGDLQARERLICSILRYAFAMATKRRGRISIMERVSWANVGAVIAVDKFDPDLGYRLSTYASWWILNLMQRGNEVVGVVNSPREAVRFHYRWMKVREALAQKWQREPYEHEIAGELGIRVDSSSVRGLRTLAPAITESCRGPDGVHHDTASLLSILGSPVAPDTSLEDQEEALVELNKMRPGDQRLVLNRAAGASYREIADVEKISPEGARQRVERAVKAARARRANYAPT